METLAWELYTYMKGHCVGIENAMNSKDMLEKMRLRGDEWKSIGERKLRYLIDEIRNNPEITRHIGSSTSRGYWLTTEKDDENYILQKVKIVIKGMRECLSLGASSLTFYKVLNEEGRKSQALDNQTRLRKGLKDVHLTSDDLLKKGKK